MLARAFVRAFGRDGWKDSGSAVVEFVGASLLLLVPLVYLILTLAQLQAAVFASESAAREAGRLVVRAETLDEGLGRAQAAVELAFADQGIAVSGADTLTVTCDEQRCLTPGGLVRLEVRATVVLPGVPSFVRNHVPAEIPVVAEHVAVVNEFRESEV